MPAAVAPVDDPEAVLAVFLRHPEAHPYGIADVAQLWERSRWWRDGEAVVGVMDLPGSPVPVLYAVSAGAEPETRRLLAALAPALPDHLVATGPVGMVDALASRYDVRWAKDYVKMHLTGAALLPPDDPRVVVLTRADLAALEELFATDPVAGDFFYAALLDTGFYVGLRHGSDLTAAGGIHVLDREHGVAAVGNVATHPDHRRQGLARAVMGTLCRRLLAAVPVVGLNVQRRNEAAQALYRGVGFRSVLPYEEAELVRRPRPS